MPAFLEGQADRGTLLHHALAVYAQVNAEDMVLCRRYFGGGVENAFAVLRNELYIGSYICEPEDIAGGVAEVEIAVAVPRLRPVDELVGTAEPVQRAPERIRSLSTARSQTGASSRTSLRARFVSHLSTSSILTVQPSCSRRQRSSQRSVSNPTRDWPANKPQASHN